MNRNPRPKSRNPKIILALDVGALNKAKYFINRLYPKIKIFKVGPQLFMSAGHRIIQLIHKKGAGVFLDLKFFDIPNTVANSVRQAVRLKVEMLTLHIQGGKPMLKAAVESADKASAQFKIKRPLLIGVTVLTSQKAHPNQILRLARIGLNCGLDGVVCSAKEAKLLKEKIRKKFVIVTPGIRSNKKISDDQRRTATVDEAIKGGSDFLVVGRPILEAKDPLKALKELV